MTYMVMKKKPQETSYQGARFSSKAIAKRQVPKKSLLSAFINHAGPGDSIKHFNPQDGLVWKIEIYWG